MQQKSSFVLIISLVLIASLTRLMPHYPNFTAIGATALFSAAMFRSKIWAMAVPVFAIFMTDLLLNNIVYASYYEGFAWFTTGAAWIYVAIGLTVILGRFVFSKVNVSRFIGGALGATGIFFFLTNFGHWAGPFSWHPKSFSGLIATYVDGLPFVLNSTLGNIFFGALLFGSYFAITQTARRDIQFEADKY